MRNLLPFSESNRILTDFFLSSRILLDSYYPPNGSGNSNKNLEDSKILDEDEERNSKKMENKKDQQAKSNMDYKMEKGKKEMSKHDLAQKIGNPVPPKPFSGNSHNSSMLLIK